MRVCLSVCSCRHYNRHHFRSCHQQHSTSFECLISADQAASLFYYLSDSFTSVFVLLITSLSPSAHHWIPFWILFSLSSGWPSSPPPASLSRPSLPPLWPFCLFSFLSFHSTAPLATRNCWKASSSAPSSQRARAMMNITTSIRCTTPCPSSK